jgi:hypothetical protein
MTATITIMKRDCNIINNVHRRGYRRSVLVVVLPLWVVVVVVIVALLSHLPVSMGQFNEPPGKRREQTFKVIEFENSNVNQRYPGLLRYYCTFRGKWSEERHPNDFPRSPSWSGPILISHSNGYRMWTGTEAATAGVESIAEVRTVFTPPPPLWSCWMWNKLLHQVVLVSIRGHLNTVVVVVVVVFHSFLVLLSIFGGGGCSSFVVSINHPSFRRDLRRSSRTNF